MNGASPAGPTRLSRLGGVILIMVGMVVVFFLGYGPAIVQSRHAREELASHSAEVAGAKQALARMAIERDLARLEGKLGMVVHDADQNNFGKAADQSTQFFNDLRGEISVPGVASLADSGRLQAILARRDEISSDLARADPAVKQKLADLYVSLDQAIAGPPHRTDRLRRWHGPY